MAAGKINLQANDGKVAGIVFEDGASGDVAVTIPKEGGKVIVANGSGNVGIGTSSPVTNLEVVGSADSAGIISVRPNGTGNLGGVSVRNSSDTVNYSFGQIVARADKITIDSSKRGTGSYFPLMLGIGGSYTFMIDTMGNSLHLNSSGGLGYGTGSGGTVTQLTSKSTAVTLNKPTGQIIMNNAALAAGAHVTFLLTNSTVSYIDNAIVTIAGGAGGYSNNRVQSTCYGGGVAITVTNQTASTLSEALVISFTIIKGAVA